MGDRETSRRGKVARLPRKIRDEVCERLADGQDAAEILAWVNGLPAVKTLLKAKFKGEPISDANLSNWRQGGFQDWQDNERQADQTRALAETSMRIAKASGGNLAEGAAAILAGKIMSGLETMLPEELDAAVLQIARLRKVELEGRRIHFLGKRVGMEELKVQRTTCEMFIDWATNRAATEIVEDKRIDRAAKTEALRKLMFGEAPTPGSP